MNLKGLFLRTRRSKTHTARNLVNRRSLLVEPLEDRSLMAGVAGGIDNILPLASGQSVAHFSAVKSAPTYINRATVLTDDNYEQNDTQSAAYNLGTLSSPLTISNLVMADSNDWYKFTATTKPGTSDTVAISLQNSQGDLDLGVYNSFGQRVRYSGTSNNTEQVSLSGFSAGTYYIRVYGYLGAKNPNYSLSVNLARPVADDAYENNDTLSTARDLGPLTSALTVSNLVMADGHDWYKFSMSGAGTSSDFVAISSSSTQGDLDLELYSSGGTRLANSQSSTNNEQISLSGRAAGTYYVHVLGYGGATTPSYSLQIDPGTQTTTPPPATGGSFDIQFRFSGLTAAQQAIFEQAAAKWESVITGDLPSATYNGVSVDDLLIDASGAAIDGPGKILGQAGPDAFRNGSGLPYHGDMEFDSADLASMISNGTMLSVIEHEMGHVLGIGTLWSSKGLLVGASTTNPIFIGAQATAAYNSIFGTSASGVPVENTGGSGTRNAHWRESILGSELMTGWVGPGTNLPMSRITIGSLADIGYTVNVAAADNFTPAIASSGALLATTTTTGSSSGSLRADPSILLSLHGSEVHDAVLTWLAGNRNNEGNSLDGLAHATQQAHEQATDALLANWSPFESALHGYLRHG
jgi:hypothetical protein